MCAASRPPPAAAPALSRPGAEPGAPIARLALAAILVLAALVRLHEVTLTPLWFDEIFTLWTARLGVDGALAVLRQDMHPPLFFLGVIGWRGLVGEAAVWLRLVPIAFGVLMVWASYALARDLFGWPAGLGAALFVALHRWLVFHSQELRSFSMLWCLQIIAVWCAWRWIRDRRARYALGYVLAAAAALYTHYLAGLVLAMVGVWGLAMTIRDPRRFAGWLGLNLGVAVLFAPQLPTFLAQLAVNRVEHWILPPGGADLAELARETAFGIRYLVPVLGLFALCSLCPARTRSGVALIALVVFGPVIATWLVTRQGAHLFTVRYMLYIVPFVLVLVAGGLAQLPSRRLGVALAAIVALFAGRALALKPAFPEAVELRRAADWLLPRMRPGDALFCTETHSLLFFRHYHAERAHPMLMLMQPRLAYYEGATLIPEAWRTTPAALDSTAGRGGRWYAVRVRHAGMDGREAAAMLDARGGGPAERWELVTVWAGPASRDTSRRRPQ